MMAMGASRSRETCSRPGMAKLGSEDACQYRLCVSRGSCCAQNGPTFPKAGILVKTGFERGFVGMQLLHGLFPAVADLKRRKSFALQHSARQNTRQRVRRNKGKKSLFIHRQHRRVRHMPQIHGVCCSLIKTDVRHASKPKKKKKKITDKKRKEKKEGTRNEKNIRTSAAISTV